MNEKARRLLIPDGVRDLLPGFAGPKREMENRIQEVFGRWGYREVATPAFEYSAVFDGDANGEQEGKVYRFLDERGRTMALRPDFTSPLARVAVTHLSNEPKPLRLCYGGNVYRHASGQQGRQREMAQAGVELIGSGCAGSDAEIIALAVDVLRALKLDDFTLCLGHVGFLQAVLDAHGVTGIAGERINHFFNRKDFVSLKELSSELQLPAFSRESILRLPTLRGGREVLAEADVLLPPGTDRGSLATLDEIWQVLEDYGVSRFITFDLGLVRALDYYTGMVFEGYTGGLGFPLCGGGRYDRLLGHFGQNSPAVGFAINTDHLLLVQQRLKKLPPSPALLFAAYNEKARAEAIARAQELRDSGLAVIIDTKARASGEARDEAGQRGASLLLYFDESGCSQTDLAGEASSDVCQ
ncbi:MAG: ATP phosphoribosyltransferase regulatory subunit [Dethiobacter sp.]|jgi:ATP phosphoribosyltransferase regulatory subunit|nr:ATP phosphoribosyltransferase regulatory subunit [Dethiobacter sp.]